MLPSLPESWRPLLSDAWQHPSLDPLRSFLADEYRDRTVYPPRPHLFRALELTPPANVKAVILGQDPYHGAGQAHGLSFSVLPGVRPPPSLGNIFKELKSDLGITAPPGLGDLSPWAERGVLLLNTVLTVRDAEPLSHRGRGWEAFTDAILRVVSELENPMAFVLWGSHAQKKLPLIDALRHEVIQSAHPSPLSARNGFFGSKPFSRINAAMKRFGRDEIDWRL
jgi:uracil-DNA glycosylase